MYQSECADQRVEERHCVEVHWWRQAGQTPPVTNVFHSCPQEQLQRSSLRGDHPHSGQRMRGPEGLFASSSSRSKTTDDSSRRVADMLVIMSHPSLQSLVSGSPTGPGFVDDSRASAPTFSLQPGRCKPIMLCHAEAPIQSGRTLASHSLGSWSDSPRCPHGKHQIGSEASKQKVHSARKPTARLRGEEYNPQPSQAVHAGARLRLRSQRTARLVRRSTPLAKKSLIKSRIQTMGGDHSPVAIPIQTI